MDYAEYAADFETNTTAEGVAKNPVWAWGLCLVGNNESFIYGLSIESFIDTILNLNKARIWFHNLAFDGKFIIDYLLRHDFKHVDQINDNRQLSTVIDDMGRFYSITFRAMDKEVVFADSFKKVTMSLAAAANTYHLDMTKGEIDYSTYRPVGHELTAQELDYLRRDVCILAQVLEQRLKMGTKLTTSADCLAAYKDLLERKKFDKLFPSLPKRADHDIRKSYKGGYVYVNPIHQNKTYIKDGVSLDVNSMYPYQMRYKTYPYGVPEFVMDERELDGLFVACIEYTATLKPGCLPCIQIKDNPKFNPREYQREIKEPLIGWFTSVDLQLMRDMYDLNIIDFLGAYKFNSQYGLFYFYIDINNYNKTHATNPGERFQAKLRNNSLYGKFGQKIEGSKKIPVLRDDDVVHYELVEGDERDPVYIPIATFVTAYARDYLIRTAVKFGDNYIYSDTDSIKAFGDVPEWLETDPKRLGYFDCEYRFKKCRFIRPKTYAVQLENGEYSYTCAGMPQGLKKVMSFDDFKIGFTNDLKLIKDINSIDKKYLSKECYKLVPKLVKGGVILEERPFTIRR